MILLVGMSITEPFGVGDVKPIKIEEATETNCFKAACADPRKTVDQIDKSNKVVNERKLRN